MLIRFNENREPVLVISGKDDGVFMSNVSNGFGIAIDAVKPSLKSKKVKKIVVSIIKIGFHF